MLKLEPKGEKFSAKCAYRVFAVLAKHKKCTIKTICEETGVSKVTAGRVIKYLMRERLVRKYPYRPISGRGVKPESYFLHPRTSCAVLDLRYGELVLYALSVPRLCRKAYAPKIRSDRPLSDKAPLLRGDCFRLMRGDVPDRYLISFSVLTDGVGIRPKDFPEDPSACIPDGIPADMFHFTSEELEARFFGREQPKDTVVYVYVTDHRRESLVFKDGKVLYSEDVSEECSLENRESEIPKIARYLTERFDTKTVYVFTPYLTLDQKDTIAESIGRDAKISFIKNDALDLRREAATSSIEILTGGESRKTRRRNMKIVLGVDYGDARTGLAVSDSLGLLAVGAGCIKCESFKKTAAAVAEAAKEKKADLIVVGNPINMNGTEGPRSEKCRAFASALEELTSLPVKLYDERLTTVSAHRFLSDANVRGKRRKAAVDELSATIILQDFLDRNRDEL